MTDIPTLEAIRANLQKISPWIVTTPVWHCQTQRLKAKLPAKTEVFLKLELFQQTGSFKARGALTTLLHLDQKTLKQGVVAASAGNHAIAVAYAAKMLGSTAKVIMPKTASHIKMERCRDYGAEVMLVENMAQALELVQAIAQQEQRHSIHPFEGPYIALGTATIGLELLEQVKNLDAVIIPIGGGGLCAGMAAAIKQLQPNCEVYGVEPNGANSMYLSLLAGKPVTLGQVQTIAESLAAPYALPYSFALCHRFVNEVVCVPDAALVAAMQLLFYEMKLAVEPAAAAALAALQGPLAARLAGKRVGLMISGTNIDLDRYCGLVNTSGDK